MQGPSDAWPCTCIEAADCPRQTRLQCAVPLMEVPAAEATHRQFGGSDGCVGVKESDGASTDMSAVATVVARYAFCDGSDICVLDGGGRRR